MLQTLLASQHGHLDTLAQAWLEAGAKTVSIWSEDQLVSRWPLDASPAAAKLVAPIRIGNRTVAEIRVDGFDNSARQSQLLREAMLVAQLAQYTAELESAKQVQAGFFPKTMPTLPGIDIFAESRQALEVGGDYYDFIRRTPDSFVVGVGDVSNKGMSAALLMAVLRKVVRTGVNVLATPTPQSLMAYINSDMYDEFSQVAMFATLFVGEFNATKRSLCYANAGHSPVIYRPRSQRARLVEAINPPIGVLSAPIWHEQTLRMEPGDLLVIATDGLVETGNYGEEPFGYKRLLALVDQVGEAPALEITQTIFAELDRFTPNPSHEDDQTLCVMKGV
ncbi:MAG: PP2C family protein-serine/threonine phosphatase [Caldilineaceae bacterium]